MSIESWKEEFYPIRASEFGREERQPGDTAVHREAVHHSLTKWIGLRKENLERHELVADGGELWSGSKPHWVMAVDSGTCALCELHASKCSLCPLGISRGGPCDRTLTYEESAPYHVWQKVHDPEPMISALENITQIHILTSVAQYEDEPHDKDCDEIDL